jgi:hypothetical protein
MTLLAEANNNLTDLPTVSLPSLRSYCPVPLFIFMQLFFLFSVLSTYDLSLPCSCFCPWSTCFIFSSSFYTYILSLYYYHCYYYGAGIAQSVWRLAATVWMAEWWVRVSVEAIIFSMMYRSGPPLWSGGQSSWQQNQKSGSDSRRYQIF